MADEGRTGVGGMASGGCGAGEEDWDGDGIGKGENGRT